jgi:uncharacterized protein YidB (DUF937 family)
MGLLDSLIGSLGQAQGGAAAAGGGGAGDLLGAVVGMLGNDAAGGGLGGLVGQFAKNGMGDIIGSWIGKGENMPISADQLSQVLGGDAIANIAQQMGMSHGDAAGQLSQMLPQIIDKLTPHGQAPAGGLGNVTDLLGMLMKR